MTDKLTSIRNYSDLWADSMDVPSSIPYKPTGATSNPVIILANLQESHNQRFLTEAVQYVKEHHSGDSKERQVELAVLRTQVGLGTEMAKHIPGLVNTQVDCRHACDKQKMTQQSREIVALYGEAGVPKNRVAIKIPSTWEGLQAAKELTKDGINCNMTTMFSLVQAVAAAEAGVAIISPYLNRLQAHFNPAINPKPLPAAQHVDLPHVLKIYNYYKQHAIKTITLGASIVHVEEVDLIAGLDALTIFPPVLDKLVKREGSVTPLFSVELAKKAEAIPAQSYLNDEAKFRQAMKDDARSSEYLQEALTTFQEYDVKLYKLVEDKF
jgi:transaldolase